MRRHTHLLIGSVVVVLVLAVISSQSPRRLTGSVLSDAAIVANLKLRADFNRDQALSVQEIRRTLTGIIRGVVSGNAQYDISGDGVIDRKDITAAVRGFKMLLLAICGDGVKQGSEQCDDGNAQDGDGCTAACKTEAICGDGIMEGDEECDVGEQQGDVCAGGGESCTYCSNCIYVTTNSDNPPSVSITSSSSPASPMCGNGMQEGSEECDDGDGNGRCPTEWAESCTYCSTDCTVITVITEGTVE